MLISSSRKFYKFHKLLLRNCKYTHTHTHTHTHRPKFLSYRITVIYLKLLGQTFHISELFVIYYVISLVGSGTTCPNQTHYYFCNKNYEYSLSKILID